MTDTFDVILYCFYIELYYIHDQEINHRYDLFSSVLVAMFYSVSFDFFFFFFIVYIFLFIYLIILCLLTFIMFYSFFEEMV